MRMVTLLAHPGALVVVPWLLGAAVSAAQAPGRPPGSGDSAWGPIAAPDSSNTSALSGQPRPTWERVVNFPYSVAFLPAKALGWAVGAAVQAADENPAVRRLLRLFPLRIGPSLVSGGLSYDSGDGLGANASLDIPDFSAGHHAFKLRLAGETRGERRATAAFRFRRHAMSRVDVGGGYRSAHNTRFYGRGPVSREEDESFYRREVAWGGAAWGRRVGSGDFGWTLGAMYSSVGATGADHSDSPHLSETFAASLPPGYRKRSEGLSTMLELIHESGERLGPPEMPWHDRLRPERGGLRRAFVSWFEGKGNQSVRYWTWRAEAQQFLPLPHSRRALALRALVSRLENEGGDPIPFQRLLTNDDPDVLRGYPDGRFHDTGLLSLTAEYRWPVWALSEENGLGVDAYLFADAGQVFSRFEQIDTDHVTKSWGGGLRLGAHGRFVGRLEIGHGDEGTQLRLRADQVFQFEKGGLFFGRSPVPER